LTDAVAPSAEQADGAAADDDVVFAAPGVLRIIWADPTHMAEHLAVWSLAAFGPRADGALAKLKQKHPDADEEELERLVVERQTLVAATEGAFVGGPFIVLIPVAFCAALLAGAQMVFELAAATGHDPNDRRRAADLLVLLGAYDSLDEAERALATMARDPHSREGKRLPASALWDTTRRMAYLLGVFGASDPTRSRLRATLGWIGVGILCVVGFVVPVVWVPYMAYSLRGRTMRLGGRARDYYAAERPGDAGVVVQRRVRIGGTAALARTLVHIVVPVGVAVAALLTGLSLGGGKVIDALLVLLAASVVLTAGWLGVRRWRRRRRRAEVPLPFSA
jgi:hypothetical protein